MELEDLMSGQRTTRDQAQAAKAALDAAELARLQSVLAAERTKEEAAAAAAATSGCETKDAVMNNQRELAKVNVLEVLDDKVDGNGLVFKVKWRNQGVDT